MSSIRVCEEERFEWCGQSEFLFAAAQKLFMR